MLDILDFAKEKGMEEGFAKGVAQGKDLGTVETTRNMLLEALEERYGIIPPRVSRWVRGIEKMETLNSLFRQVFRCENLAAFEEMLARLEKEE